MKYVVVLGDGMSDRPVPALGGMTPLEAAVTPTLDALASAGELGMVQNVPEGMVPGSDVANLSVLGYGPHSCYTGRSSLEALSLGVTMEPGDVAFRCNLVTLTEPEPYREKTILDHSAGEISATDGAALMETVRQAFQNDTFRFYTGTGYRHILVWKGGRTASLAPPHDHLGSVIGPWLPEEPVLRRFMEVSYDILSRHPLNQGRDRRKANSIWFWGPGTQPRLDSFQSRTGKRGAMISAVDLLKGIAKGAGMTVCQVPGATGLLDTNYAGKAQAALDALLKDNCDLAFIHLEAPDEMGHQGLAREKVQAIEHLDREIAAPVWEGLRQAGEDFRMLILPDHATPVSLRTHTAEPVPYLLYDSTRQLRKRSRYTEEEAKLSGSWEPEGHRLMQRFLQEG